MPQTSDRGATCYGKFNQLLVGLYVGLCVNFDPVMIKENPTFKSVKVCATQSYLLSKKKSSKKSLKVQNYHGIHAQ